MSGSGTVIPYANISGLIHAPSPLASAGAFATVAAHTSTSTVPDGLGGTYYCLGSSTTYTPNGYSVVSSSDTNIWLLVDSYGPPVNVLNFGADPTATHDSTAAFTSALSTGKSVLAPPGRYLLSATISVTSPGQLLFGTQPNNPYGDSGTMGGTTLRFSGATSSACIVVGGGTSEAWTGIKSLAIDGAEVTNPIPAIVVEGGYNVTLDNLYLDQPFNGILVSATSTTHINRVVVDGARGVYGFLLTGTSGGVTDTVDMIDIDVSGNVITLPTNATAASGASVISVAATGSGVVSGMMAGGSYSLQAGTTVVSAGASTVSLSRPLTASIASGTTLSFGQIGLWIDSNCNGASVVFPRNTALSTALYIASSTAGTPPSDLRIYDIDAQSLAADSVVNLAGNTVSLLAPMISGGSGRGIAFGAAATDMSVIGGGITLQAYTGVEIAGTGFQIEQSVVGENSQASTGLYNGIVVSSGASRVRIVGNQIGYAAGASLQQGYGISNLDSTAGEILVIGNDLRGNSGGPISGGGPAILGANLGIATGGYTNSTSSSFTLNPSDTYVGIVNTGSTAVNIHLPTTPSYNQEIEIKDESGTAQTHTINIYPPAGSSVTIQGAINTGINSNYGSLKLRFNNDLTWFFVS